MATDDSPFLARWSRRKAQARTGDVLPEQVVESPPPAAPTAITPTPAPAAELPATTEAPPPLPPPLTLADVAQLTRDSDYSAFVARGVTPEIKNAALKKLFTDPHFNIMDGLDTYIDDYGKPDPLPPGMLRQMVQSKMLGLFDDEDEDPKTDPLAAATHPPATPALPPDTPTDEDPALQLQPDDDPGRAGPEPGAVPDAGRQH